MADVHTDRGRRLATDRLTSSIAGKLKTRVPEMSDSRYRLVRTPAFHVHELGRARL